MGEVATRSNRDALRKGLLMGVALFAVLSVLAGSVAWVRGEGVTARLAQVLGQFGLPCLLFGLVVAGTGTLIEHFVDRLSPRRKELFNRILVIAILVFVLFETGRALLS